MECELTHPLADVLQQHNVLETPLSASPLQVDARTRTPSSVSSVSSSSKLVFDEHKHVSCLN